MLVPSHKKRIFEASNGRSFPPVGTSLEFQLRDSSGLRPRPRTLEPAQLTGSKKNDGMRQQDFQVMQPFEEVLQILWFKKTIYPSASKMFINLRKVQPKITLNRNVPSLVLRDTFSSKSWLLDNSLIYICSMIQQKEFTPLMTLMQASKISAKGWLQFSNSKIPHPLCKNHRTLHKDGKIKDLHLQANRNTKKNKHHTKTPNINDTISHVYHRLLSP